MLHSIQLEQVKIHPKKVKHERKNKHAPWLMPHQANGVREGEDESPTSFNLTRSNHDPHSTGIYESPKRNGGNAQIMSCKEKYCTKKLSPVTRPCVVISTSAGMIRPTGSRNIFPAEHVRRPIELLCNLRLVHIRRRDGSEPIEFYGPVV